MTRKAHGSRVARQSPARRKRGRRQSPVDGRSEPPAAQPEPAEIEINNLQAHVRITAREIRAIVNAVLTAEKVAGATLSVVLADDATVRRVNRDFLQHDYDTDVLSFLFESKSLAPRRADSNRAVPRGQGRHIDGEVLASAQMAVEMAQRFGWSAREELTLYLVHGLLHLCGYDDLTPSEKRIMRRREQTILAELGIVVRRGEARRQLGKKRLANNGSRS